MKSLLIQSLQKEAWTSIGSVPTFPLEALTSYSTRTWWDCFGGALPLSHRHELGPSQSELCTYLTTMMNVIHSGMSR